MLERLVIRDLVLVERAEVEFGPDLNVVTGETGAGKSLLVQAVDLLTGGRADPAVVREGAKAAVVEGEFRPSARAALRIAPLLAAWGVESDGDSLIEAAKGMKGAIARAHELVAENPGAIIPQQFENPANPQIHRQTTAEEIWNDTDGKVDVFVKGPGSGRETAIRSLQAAGLEVGAISDVTPQPHNGCRPPKRRRV